MGIKYNSEADGFDFTNPPLRVQFRSPNRGSTLRIETAADGARTLTVTGPDIKPEEDGATRASATRAAMAATFHSWLS